MLGPCPWAPWAHGPHETHGTHGPHGPMGPWVYIYIFFLLVFYFILFFLYGGWGLFKWTGPYLSVGLLIEAEQLFPSILCGLPRVRCSIHAHMSRGPSTLHPVRFSLELLLLLSATDKDFLRKYICIYIYIYM